MSARLTAALIASLLALSSASSAELVPAESVAMSSARLNDFRRAMHSLVDERKLAGVVTLVARHGKLVAVDAYGYRDLESQVPLQNDSLFLIASMTKPITGVAMMLLYEEGKWRLDDPVAKHIPEFKGLQVSTAQGGLEPQRRPMTMRQLMSHSAGFDINAAPAYEAVKLRDRNQPMRSLIEKLSKLPLAFQPGTQWRYGPSADVQAYLVEELSGQSFGEFLQTRIFAPLRMRDTGFWPLDASTGARSGGRLDASKLNRLSRLHRYDANGRVIALPEVKDPSIQPLFPSGSGGLITSAEDYWRFAQMLLNGGTLDSVRLLRPETVALMRTNMLEPGVELQTPGASPAGLGFGLDVAVVLDPAQRASPQAKGAYYWGGGTGTWFWIDPVNDLVVVGMIHMLGPGAPDMFSLSAHHVYRAVAETRR